MGPLKRKSSWDTESDFFFSFPLIHNFGPPYTFRPLDSSMVSPPFQHPCTQGKHCVKNILIKTIVLLFSSCFSIVVLTAHTCTSYNTADDDVTDPDWNNDNPVSLKFGWAKTGEGRKFGRFYLMTGRKLPP